MWVEFKVAAILLLDIIHVNGALILSFGINLQLLLTLCKVEHVKGTMNQSLCLYRLIAEYDHC
jgi:hypothetical protein